MTGDRDGITLFLSIASFNPEHMYAEFDRNLDCAISIRFASFLKQPVFPGAVDGHLIQEPLAMMDKQWNRFSVIRNSE